METKINQPIFGIDISKYQAKLDFKEVIKAGVQFVIIRGGYSSYTNKKPSLDPYFNEFYSKCVAYGLPKGLYWFTCATSYEEGKKEAEFLYEKCLKGRKFELPIYIDVEDDTKVHHLQKAGNKAIAEGINGFCEYLEKKKYYVGIYASSYWFKKYIDYSLRKKYDVWIASYGKVRPTIPHGIWQFGGETNLIRSNKIGNVVCDMNYCYKDYPSIMKKAHLNGY